MLSTHELNSCKSQFHLVTLKRTRKTNRHNDSFALNYKCIKVSIGKFNWWYKSKNGTGRGKRRGNNRKRQEEAGRLLQHSSCRRWRDPKQFRIFRKLARAKGIKLWEEKRKSKRGISYAQQSRTTGSLQSESERKRKREERRVGAVHGRAMKCANA